MRKKILIATQDPRPYEGLDPELIIDAVEKVGFHPTGSLLSLNSYENRVYQIGMEEGPPVVAKFYRPHRWSNEAILEEHAFSLELTRHEIPIVAPIESTLGETLHDHEGFRFALFHQWGGRALELDRYDQLEWMGRFIGRLHAISRVKSFEHRPMITMQTYLIEPYQYLLEHQFLPAYMESRYRAVVDALMIKIEEIIQAVGPLELIRLHGDLHAGNVLWNDAGPHIVDLDDCMMGPAIQDIWMLLTGEQEYQAAQLEAILSGYEDFCDFDKRELAYIEILRTFRQIHYAAWLAKRINDPAFSQSFSWFNTERYWEDHMYNLNEQIERLPESTL